MNGAGPTARALLVSIVPDERRGNPGAALRAALADPSDPANLLVAANAALAAGEARRALRLLDTVTQSDAVATRRVHALRVLALVMDRNWYPGDSGGEFARNVYDDVAPVDKVEPGDAETMLMEANAAFGRASVLGLRLMSEESVRKGVTLEQNRPLLHALRQLEQFRAVAVSAGAAGAVAWAVQSQSDLLWRVGQADAARQAMDALRGELTARGDAEGLAHTWLVEGDWYAAPGSSPDALGLGLTHDEPSPLAATLDVTRAADAYDRAATLLQDLDAPRLLAALAVRRAFLRLLAEDIAGQRVELDAAERSFLAAGETSGRHLVLVHRLVGALAEGQRVQLRQIAPPEWGAAAGPLAEIAHWGSKDGSASFTTGLGRILERTARGWRERGDYERAEFAYLMARPLLPASGAVPAWSVSMWLAELDKLRNVHLRAVARRLHVLASLPPPPPLTKDPVGWMRDLDLTNGLIEIPGGSFGSGLLATRVGELAAKRLRQLLDITGAPRSSVPAPLDSERVMADLKAKWAALTYDDVALGKHNDSFIEPAVTMAYEALEQSEPLLGLQRAQIAERRGWDAEADLLYESVLAQTSKAAPRLRWLGLLTLCRRGRYDEARVLLAAMHAAPVGNETLLEGMLALRARDFAAAQAWFARNDAATDRATMHWMDLLDRAESALENQRAADARDLAQLAIARLEAHIDALARDADRLLAGDDIKAAALYQIAARACIDLAQAHDTRGEHDAARTARDAGLAYTDRGQALGLPRGASMASVAEAGDDAAVRPWQQAAAEQATAYQRYLAALAMDDGAPVDALAEALTQAERNLVEIEARLPDARNTALQRWGRLEPLAPGAAAACLPADTCLLQYHLVGRDVVAWGASTRATHGVYTRLAGRPIDGAIERVVHACSLGDPSADAAELAALLLAPFADLLHDHARVIVVPSGSLHALPFHVLPWQGAPLGATHVLSYLPASALMRPGEIDRPLAAGSTLVIGDPAFEAAAQPTLKRLPGAALESRLVGALHPDAQVFAGAAAREADLRPRLAGHALLHVAAHGRLDEIAPNTSSIVLAGQDELTVSDLIGLHIGADLAVLSACDTGRGLISLGGNLVGMTRGLLAAGIRRSVVSLWPVDDVAACVTMVVFHQHLRTLPPARALAQAQATVRALSGAELADRYRGLGGDLAAGKRAVRRKGSGSSLAAGLKRVLAPFPERDEDDDPPRTVEESHGSLASNWAPFVLIGG